MDQALKAAERARQISGGDETVNALYSRIQGEVDARKEKERRERRERDKEERARKAKEKEEERLRRAHDVDELD